MNNHIEEVPAEKQDKGFTLVELLIVIVILGILATVTVFAVRGITDQGQSNACKATAKTYEVAIEAFYAQNGNSVHPTGAALETAQLIRKYDGSAVAVSTPAAGGTTSTVAVVSGGKCATVVL